MAKEELNSINVDIAGRTYPIFVTENEEEVVMQIAENLNSEIQDMHSRYANKLGKTDIISMLLLTYAKKLHDAYAEETQQQLAEKLDEIYFLLEEANSKSE